MRKLKRICSLPCIMVIYLQKMQSEFIKELLEKKCKKTIRYHADIEFLSFEIEKQTQRRIGINTLKRLLGFLPPVKQPQLYTLDTVALFVGYRDWNELEKSLCKDTFHISNTFYQTETYLENIAVKYVYLKT